MTPVERAAAVFRENLGDSPVFEALVKAYEREAELTSLLRRLEWAEYEVWQDKCPICDEYGPEAVGPRAAHAVDCTLAHMLDKGGAR